LDGAELSAGALASQELSSIRKTSESRIGKHINIVLHGDCVIGVIQLVQDVSAYEKALTELSAYKQLNELLDAIIESSFDGIWVCDRDGRVLRVNTASAKMDGVATNHFIGQKMEDLVSQGFIDKSVTLEVLKKKTAITLLQKTKDGKEILVTGNPVLDENGEVKLVVVNERDYTILNRLRHKLEESRALAQKYRSELSQIYSHDDLLKKLVVRSKSMERVIDRALKVSCVDSTVLIQGSSGVGKSLICKVIHHLSNRKSGPLIRVDCGAIPESLIESELFGYEKGAFTGANEKGKPGLFELADGGTLFLDEVAELNLNTQVKLLRFIEDKELIRVGGTVKRKIDVRIIAATNRDLKKMVREKTFRKDLFFRLSVVPLHIPELADRVDDIPPLINHFLNQFNAKCSTNKTIDPQVVDCLCRYRFPGNIRELANLIEQLIVLTPHDHIRLGDLPAHIQTPEQSIYSTRSERELDLKRSVQRLEKELIIKALTTYGTQIKAAHHLGIDQATLSRKMKKYNIKSIMR